MVALEKQENTPGNRQKSVGSWTAGIFTALGLAFLSLSVYVVFVQQDGHFDLSDKVLMPVAGLMFILSLISFILIRRNQHALGAGILFAVSLIPPVIATLVLTNFVYISIFYIVVLASALIFSVIPRTSRTWAIVVALLMVLATVGIEIWNPAFRADSPVALNFAYLATPLAALGLLAFSVRQALIGNIRTKLITGFLIIGVASTATVAFLADRSSRANLTAEITKNQASLARSQAFQIGQAIISEFDKAKGLAAFEIIQTGIENAGLEIERPVNADEIQDLDQAWKALFDAKNRADALITQVLDNDLSTELRKYQGAFLEIEEILVTDQKGFNVASTTFTPNYYQADTPWWQQAYANGQFIGQPIFDLTTNSIALNMAVPIYSDTSKEFLGVLRMTVNFNVLNDVLIQTQFGKDAYSLIYQPNGRILKLLDLGNGNYQISQEFASAELQNFSLSSDSTEFILQDYSKPSGWGTGFTVRGIPVLASSALVEAFNYTGDINQAVADLDWHVVVLQNKADALKSVNIQARNNIILAVVINIFVILGAIILARFISAPVLQLNAIAGQIASGDLNVEAKIETHDEIGTLAGTFNSMTSQLRNLLGGLETQVANRTQELEHRAAQLQTAAEVARDASLAPDLTTLLDHAVRLIADRFGFFHAGIFLLDDTGEYAVLRAASSEGGQRMLARRHRLQVGKTGIVGYVTERGEPRIALDVGEDSVFFDNPDLPETRSEMALPLMVREEIIGALDVQSEKAKAFDEGDITILQILADLIALAIYNTRLIQQVQESLEVTQRAYGEISQQAWRELLGSRNFNERYDPLGVLQATEGELPTLSVPIFIRGQRVGAIKACKNNKNESWSQEETTLMETITEQIGLALESARLYGDTQRRAERDQLTQKLSDRIHRAADIDLLMQTVIEDVANALGASGAFVQLGVIPEGEDGNGSAPNQHKNPEAQNLVSEERQA